MGRNSSNCLDLFYNAEETYQQTVQRLRAQQAMCANAVDRLHFYLYTTARTHHKHALQN